MRTNLYCWIMVLLIAGRSPEATTAGDWPQILGPFRNGHTESERLAPRWDSPPTRRWVVSVGAGYAGPAVVSDRLLLFHRRDNIEQLDCLNRLDGKQIWSATFKATYRGGVDADLGPRCVPLVHEQTVYVYDAAADLHAVDLMTGNVRWSRFLGSDYGVREGYFGAGSTPLIHDKLLFVNVGGRKANQGILALDLSNGKTVWTHDDDEASYAAPNLWKRGDDTQLIFVTRLHALGLRPSDGEELFRLPFGKRGPTVNAALPLVGPQQELFLTASYGIGAQVWNLSADPPALIWKSDDSLSSQYPTPILHQGFLYGNHGREDGAPASLRCVRWLDGKVMWEEKNVGMSHLIFTAQPEPLLVILRTEGELLLVPASPEKYEVRGRVTVSESITRALPALAHGTVYLRNTEGALMAWELPQSQSQ